MSEKFHDRRPESGSSPELQRNNLGENRREFGKIHRNSAEAKHEHQDNIEKIRSSVEKEAASKNDEKKALKEQKPDRAEYISKGLLDETYRRSLARTRRKLPVPLRAFSRFVHAPLVETASEVSSKTIARPSGILAGGIAALLGSGVVLWAAKYYGYEYNFLLFALLFVGGYFLGLFVELLSKFALTKRRKN